MPGDKWEQKYTASKSMCWSKSSSKREVCSDTCLLQGMRKVLSNPTLKELEGEQTKPRIRRRRG